MCRCYLYLCWYFHFSKQNNNRNNERSITSKESSKAGRSGWPSMGRHSSCWVASKTRRARANDQVVSLNLRQSGRQKMKRTINNNNNNNMLVEHDQWSPSVISDHHHWSPTNSHGGGGRQKHDWCATGFDLLPPLWKRMFEKAKCLRPISKPISRPISDQDLNRFRAQDVCSPPANDPCTLTTGSTSRQRADIFGLVPAQCGTLSSLQRAEYNHLEWNSLSSPSSFLFLLHSLFLGMKDTISFSGSLFRYSASLL